MPLSWYLCPFGFTGHLVLWVAFINHTEATAMPRWMRRTFIALAVAALVMLPAWLWSSGAVSTATAHATGGHPPWVATGYLLLCTTVATVWLCAALLSVGGRPRCSALLASETRSVDLRHTVASHRRNMGFCDRLLLNVPGNQMFRVDESQRHIVLQRLPAELEGLAIAHLSDLHFDNKMPRAYYEELVRMANGMDADLAVITGDLMDHADCLPWLPDVLGRVRSRHGNFYILGNHDLKVNCRELRDRMRDAGWIDLGGRWDCYTLRGTRVVLAGNELPWFAPAADMTGDLGSRAVDEALRIVLAHTPDQLDWARRYGFDLMLAGHTHGGQVRLPWVGPIVCPTRKPLRYCDGVYSVFPTVVNVSRGLSAETPLRWNCPPEMIRIVLRSPTTAGQCRRVSA